MPEGVAYYDMSRMIAAQVPGGTYKFELHTRWFRRDPSDNILISPEIIDGLIGKLFQFSGATVGHWGEALGIPLCDGIWLRLRSALHEYALPAATEGYLWMVQAWDDDGNEEAEFNTTILEAVVGEKMTIMIVDR